MALDCGCPHLQVMTYNVVMRGGHLVYNVGGVRKR
jgi:hypothetical protein